MNELKTNSKKTKAKIMTVPEIISISISLIAVMVSLLIFFLPLVKNHFTIEDPAVVYIRSSKNSNYDELVIPIICNNYGNFIRTINNMECTLSFEDKLLPMKPFYIYDEIDYDEKNAEKRLYSSFIVEPNAGITKYIGFKYSDTNFSHKDKIPSEFHFESNKLYNFNIRFYTTRNSFIKKDRELIQSLYVFETENDFPYDFSPTKQTWFKITGRKILPSYK